MIVAVVAIGVASRAGDPIKIGLNYPETGPYAAEGLDQMRAARLAAEEINAAGGILGQPIELVLRDSKSKPDVSKGNAAELIDKQGVKMIFGGASSGVAVAVGAVCEEKGIPFFGTLTYSTDTTGKDGHRHTFRECYDSYSAAKAMSGYMNQRYAGKTYFYITADYTWGWTTEAAFRKFTNTTDPAKHKGVKTPFPSATEADFQKALSLAKIVKPDVLVLVLFGNDMSTAIRLATAMGLKASSAIVVPNLTLAMAEGAGPKVMEGVVGALPWDWSIPYKYKYPGGEKFVEDFSAKYKRYPSTSGASAYTILREYKAAVERAGSAEPSAVIKALEGHAYTLLKDEQTWRDFDHQSIQTVYVVKCKPEAEVLKDKYRLDYFEILSSVPGSEAFPSRDEWNELRKAAGKPTQLEDLPQ